MNEKSGKQIVLNEIRAAARRKRLQCMADIIHARREKAIKALNAQCMNAFYQMLGKGGDPRNDIEIVPVFEKDKK